MDVGCCDMFYWMDLVPKHELPHLRFDEDGAEEYQKWLDGKLKTGEQADNYEDTGRTPSATSALGLGLRHMKSGRLFCCPCKVTLDSRSS